MEGLNSKNKNIKGDGSPEVMQFHIVYIPSNDFPKQF